MKARNTLSSTPELANRTTSCTAPLRFTLAGNGFSAETGFTLADERAALVGDSISLAVPSIAPVASSIVSAVVISVFEVASNDLALRSKQPLNNGNSAKATPKLQCLRLRVFIAFSDWPKLHR